jgi:hypothetical protein
MAFVRVGQRPHDERHTCDSRMQYWPLQGNNTEVNDHVPIVLNKASELTRCT